MTSTTVPAIEESRICVLKSKGLWLMSSFASPRRHEERGSTPDPTASQSEQLLNIDGLLEIARLIEEIKRDGRLKTGQREGTGRARTSRKSHVKDQ